MKKDANAELRATVRSIMQEAMGMPPEAGRVDSSIMGAQIKERLGDEFFEIAMGVVRDVEEKVMVHASVVINQHNMMDSQFGRLSPRTLRDAVEEFDEMSDDKAGLERELAGELEDAMTKFATQLADYVVHIIGPSAR